ncbi:hypothetical protein [Shewanella putrefaciens]|uniref:hypothetical protein n=1 Tax=Shewanella putrefaciens TaxID=24 RepID=UPI003D78D7F2
MAEPTKLTQAQALFAVLAGAAQSRRERVYYRGGVLRSSLYPIYAGDSVTVDLDVQQVFIMSQYLDKSTIGFSATVELKSVRVDYGVSTPDSYDIAVAITDFTGIREGGGEAFYANAVPESYDIAVAIPVLSVTRVTYQMVGYNTPDVDSYNVAIAIPSITGTRT